MGQENVYFGTEPLKPGTPSWNLRVCAGGSQASRAASNNQTRTPWMATMTKGDHMADYQHTGTPEGVRASVRGKQ
jgi:hypothetical protein